VLANDHRAFLSLVDPFGQEQDAVGDHVRENVHDNLEARELGFVVDSSRTDVGGRGTRWCGRHALAAMSRAMLVDERPVA
jgi:hypothetical protein